MRRTVRRTSFDAHGKTIGKNDFDVPFPTENGEEWVRNFVKEKHLHPDNDFWIIELFTEKNFDSYMDRIEQKGEEFLVRKKYLKEEKILKSKKYFDKYGAVCILFSWLPIIGDPLTFIAGVLKYRLSTFILLVVIAKFSRYLFIALVVI